MLIFLVSSALVRKSYFTKNQKDYSEFYNVYVFGIQSCAGTILTFHVMVDNGMVRSRVPISEIYTKIPIKIFHLILNNCGIVLVKMYQLLNIIF
jgi:hypothetical protein